MNPIQLPLAVRVRDDATLANFYPGANAAALGYVERMCALDDNWVESFIWLWGGRASGRSHLLQAACLETQEQGGTSLYLPMADCKDSGPEILDGVEACTLLALDDIEQVLGKSEWDEALFHAFNRLRDAGGKLLVSAVGSPRELQGMLPDLQSRFNLALIFHLHGLSDEEKLRALQLRASRRGLFLAEEVGRYLLTHYGRSMDALLDALEQLDRASLQAQRRLTVPFVKQILFNDGAE